MDTEVKNTISAEEQEAQYDASAKRLLGSENYIGAYTGKYSR